MITKTALENIVSKQRKMLANVSPDIRAKSRSPFLPNRPYAADRGRARMRMQRVAAPDAEQRLSRSVVHRLRRPAAQRRFRRGDFTKLDRLLEESGKGIALFNRIDLAAGWIEFATEKIRQGIKIVSTVSLETLLRLAKPSVRTGQAPSRIFSRSPLDLFRTTNFSFTHKPAGEQAVNEFLSRELFPDSSKRDTPKRSINSTRKSLCKDAVIAGGIRDRNTPATDGIAPNHQHRRTRHRQQLREN